MKVVAQSQPAAKVGYIHLAYISAQLGKSISKGELFPTQAMLGIAVATAVACAAIAGRLSRQGRRGRAIKIGVILGFFGAVVLLWAIQAVWSENRSNDKAVDYVIKTRQFWALREPALAEGIEAAAATNAVAACMAADYYGLKGGNWAKTPELAIKSYRFADLAARQGKSSHWVRTSDLTNSLDAERMKQSFEVALKNGQLTSEEQFWTKQQIARMAEQASKENQSELKR